MATTENLLVTYEKGDAFVMDPEIERFINITEDGVPLPFFVQSRYLEDLKHFEVRPDDVIIISYPRSGTTLTLHIVTQIVYGQVDKHIEDLNFFLEFPQNPYSTINDDMSEVDAMYKLAEQAHSPRLLKSHLPMTHVPPQIFTRKPKIIYVARNPKDTAVSFYHFTKSRPEMTNYKDWSEFFEYYCRGLVPWGDFFSHVISYWELRNEPNVLYLKFEDILRDLKGTVDKISNFLGKSITSEELDEISRSSTFDEMSKNKNCNLDLVCDFPGLTQIKEGEKKPKFMRKGKVGDWRNYFTLAQNDRFDALYQTKMAHTDLTFDFEL